MSKHPLGEIFGFPSDNHSAEATRYRKLKLCPFNNKVPNCTKDKASAPLGVCCVVENGFPVITCPVRFREDWIIAEDAAAFFFPETAMWTSLTEVRLKDADNGSAGNIDVVLVSYDDRGKVVDFGALEVQAVYISGNVRNPFEHYMKNPKKNSNFDWSSEEHYPRPDYLSSSRKRLAPQLLFKGGIFHTWGKRTAVALDRSFFQTLPRLDEVSPEEAEIAWLIYDLELEPEKNRYHLIRHRSVFTKFSESLNKITVPKPGRVSDFISVLQEKLDQKLTAPINKTISDEL